MRILNESANEWNSKLKVYENGEEAWDMLDKYYCQLASTPEKNYLVYDVSKTNDDDDFCVVIVTGGYLGNKYEIELICGINYYFKNFSRNNKSGAIKFTDKCIKALDSCNGDPSVLEEFAKKNMKLFED